MAELLAAFQKLEATVKDSHRETKGLIRILQQQV